MRDDRDTSQTPSVHSPLHEALLGNNLVIQEVRNLIKRLAQTELMVLITGETGTGKDIVARLLHNWSVRAQKSFVKVNCPSISEGILESELFGYERGAFTGADTSKPGRFELAHEGTIFLDEISETTQHLQSKLLQVLDGEPFLRIGGTMPVHTSARVVAATNVPINEAISSGRLRKDVAFRLSEVVVHLPPLRERREDIPLLAEHFNHNMCTILKKDYEALSTELTSKMVDYAWPGNVRELAGRVKEYVATGSPEVLFFQESDLPSEGVESREEQESDAPVVEERKFMSLREVSRRASEVAERALIEETLRYTLWNRRKAAKLLDTSYSSLLRRIEAYKIGKS